MGIFTGQKCIHYSVKEIEKLCDYTFMLEKLRNYVTAPFVLEKFRNCDWTFMLGKQTCNSYLLP